MAYPFLPVNPCCTDVVLNTPCGCTSTLPNTGCGQSQCGTNVILSSNVLYNGPVLDCIIAEPCDTLNVILQKIDEIICNLLVQINTLNIQVANITTQIININNEITNINNTLDDCCNATTTTTTTLACACTTYRLVGPSVNPGSVTYVPCGATQVVTQTATNVVQLICVDNTSGVIRIGNVSFINLLTCCAAPTTTTTTTAPIPTYCYTLSAEGKVSFFWIDVNGDPQTITITNNVTYVCAQLGSVVANGAGEIDGGIILCTSDLDCAVVPTTTTTSTSTTAVPTTTTTSSSSTSTSTTIAPTTTTTTTCPCYIWDIDATQADVDAGLNLDYISCNGDPTNEEIIGPRPFTRCIQSGSTPELTRNDSAPLEGSTVTITSECCTSPPPISSTTTTTSTTLPSGNLIVENESTNLTVNTITSAAGTIIIPVVPPLNTITGSHSDLPTPINVNITMSSAFINCMSLYVNGGFIQNINVTGTGTYSFNVTPILVTDIVRIEIVNLACIP